MELHADCDLPQAETPSLTSFAERAGCALEPSKRTLAHAGYNREGPWEPFLLLKAQALSSFRPSSETLQTCTLFKPHSRPACRVTLAAERFILGQTFAAGVDRAYTARH
jgi:hypothetical protein